jgi:hypothetical protein
VKTGASNDAKTKVAPKKALPPKQPASIQDYASSSPPIIPPKANLEKKKKTLHVPGPEADSGSSGPTRGPVFFSDLEDDEPPSRTQRDSRIPSEDREDFQSFVRRISRTTKRKAVVLESESQEDDSETYRDQENEDSDEDREDEEDRGQRNVKMEHIKIRYPPMKGKKRNSPPCEACVKRNHVCYSQDSKKSRGACFECGSMKTKCIFPVSYLIKITTVLW